MTNIEYKYMINIYLVISIWLTGILSVRSQTVWLDVDTGKIVGVSKSQSNQQVGNYGQVNYNGNRRPQYGQTNTLSTNYPVNNQRVGVNNLNPMWNCRNSRTGFNFPVTNEVMFNTFPEILQQAQRSNFPRQNYPNYNRKRQYGHGQQNHYRFEFAVQRRKRSTLDPEWVCTNSKTGDMLVIASEVMTDKFPESNQNTLNNQRYPNQYENNPWLNGQNQPNQPNNQIPQQNVPQNPLNWGQNNQNIPQNPPNWGQNNQVLPTTSIPQQNIPQNLPNWGQNNQVLPSTPIPQQNIPQNLPNWGQNNQILPTTPIPQQNIPQNPPNWGQNNQNIPQNPPNWGQNNQNPNNPINLPPIQATPEPTDPPAIILTTKKPFPKLEDIDWLQYIETTTKPIPTTTTTTTKKPALNPTSLSQAIDGEGIIMPRGNFEK
ncbi:putative uncharacterized protein DDB_G0282133 [Microplitis mediator]|uniref:putative uncharacterized protein DDB_G0282133 n=1 Tax=Microplitis mediator TaxID=375433 RepID=UPI0025523626|nr:putative uncharacterized protein DDB_G0282133 [Microplitis mediator]